MTTKAKTPEFDETTFDLDAWVGGATGTTRTVTIYGKNAIIAELDEIAAELERVEAIPKGARSVGDPSPLKLREKWNARAAEWSASRLPCRVQGVDEERQKELRAEVQKNLKSKQGIKKAEREAAELRRIMREAIVFPAFPDDDALLKFIKAIGDPQYVKLIESYTESSWMAPEVTAPFSASSSEDDDGDDS